MSASLNFHFEPHVHTFWRNTVDVSEKSEPTSDQATPVSTEGKKDSPASKKLGSFVTYGKIMKFFLSIFGTKFNHVLINDKIHYVKGDDLRKCQTAINSAKGDEAGSTFKTKIDEMITAAGQKETAEKEKSEDKIKIDKDEL